MKNWIKRFNENQSQVVTLNGFDYYVNDDEIQPGDHCIYFKQNQDDDFDKTEVFKAGELSHCEGRKTVNRVMGDSYVAGFYFTDECKKIISHRRSTN